MDEFSTYFFLIARKLFVNYYALIMIKGLSLFQINDFFSSFSFFLRKNYRESMEKKETLVPMNEKKNLFL